MADDWAGLQIIDVANLQNPVPLGSYDTPGRALSVTVVGTIAYVADGSTGLQIIDVSNPKNPVLLRTYAWNLQTENMCISDNILYTANAYYGLYIHDLNQVDITDDVVVAVPQPGLSIYPNPFVADTKLEVSLPQAERVKLSLYNIRGQLVRYLCDDYAATGQHSFTWDGKDNSGRDVPVGIYLVRYDNGKQRVLKKVTRF